MGDMEAAIGRVIPSIHLHGLDGSASDDGGLGLELLHRHGVEVRRKIVISDATAAVAVSGREGRRAVIRVSNNDETVRSALTRRTPRREA